MRKIYWYITAYLRKRGWQLLLASGVSVLLFYFLIPYLIETVTRKNTYFIGIIGEYQLPNLPSMITEQLSRGLLKADADGSFIPDLAEKVIIEDEGKKYRVILPENIYWQDGEKLQISNINYPLRDTTIIYENQEIVYELPEPFASFPQYLTAPLLKPKTESFGRFFQTDTLIGLKPVKIRKTIYKDRTKTDLAEIVLDDLAERKRYVYRFYYTQDQAIEAFKMGQIDYLFDVTNIEEIAGWPTVATNERVIADQYLAVFFNNQDPVLTKNMRLALSYAVNKERSGFQRALGPIPKDSWAYLKGLKTYDQNFETAVERLLTELPTKPLEIELITTTTYFNLASDIKKDWEELGERAVDACLESKEITDKKPCEYLRLQVKIQIQNFPNTQNFQTLLLGQEVSLDPDQYSLWHSDLASNFTKYKNTRVDSLLERGRKTIDQQERQTLYQSFQQALLDDPPAIFLWFVRSSDLTRK